MTADKLRLLLWVLVAVPAFGQTQVPPFELERLTLNPAGRSGLVVGGADLLEQRTLRVSLTGHYEHDPLVFLGEGNQRLGAVVGGRATAHLAAAFGLTRWLEAGLSLPVVLWQGGASGLDTVGVAPPASTVLGTPWLQARAGLLSQEQGAPVDLALTAMLGLPVGSGAGLTRDEGVSFVPRLGAGRRLNGFVRAAAELGAWLRPTQPLSPGNAAAADQVGSELDLGLGATTLGEGLRGEASLRLLFPLTRQPVSAELLLGARYPLGGVELYALAGPGFGRTPGTPAFRVLLGAAWGWAPAKPKACVEGTPYALESCPDLDLDGDGVKNAADRCPRVKGLAGTAGCPDADGDGLADDADACPAEPGSAARKGCPQKDTDGDGLFDEEDACPAETGPAARKGCPPKDADKDGVLDEDDACPAEPGPAEKRGCPPKDSDGDGVLDEADACPAEPGDVRYAGCPPKDADKDGVEDADDNCKTEPGPKENQGCPAKTKQLVVITREKLVIKDRVYFDVAKATIQKRSFPLLDQVAKILKEHDEVRRVVVEGHTDSQGKADYNRKLSQGRAESVKAYLVKQGVGPERLEAKGYGPDRPIADNKAAAGRELNRRVEFVISTPEKSESKTIEVP